jgi:methyltransferase (TIGR00027 family)/uncharacterized protein (TIGR02118 family)
MIKLSAFYQNIKGNNFDKDYFLNSHMPLVEKVWGSALRKTEIDFGVCGTSPGSPPEFTTVVHLYFDSIQSFQGAFSPQQQEIEQQIPKFTDIKPVVQISMVHSSVTQDNAIENSPSRTAVFTAYCRALAAKDERSEIRGPDSTAELFVPEEMRRSFSNREIINSSIRMISPLYGLLIARTLFYDALFTKALSDRIPQIVFLGAGYDTRSYRFQDKLGNTTIYELDSSPTQKRKLEIVSKSKIDIPRQIKYIPVNFKTDTIEDVLKSSGYDTSLKTLFIWEGVTFYLNENDFKKTLNVVRSIAPQGSSISFDYLTEKRESGNPSEPYQFWIDSNKLSKYLLSCSIDIVDHVDSQEMEKRYLTLKNGTLAEKSSEQYCFVHGIFK